MNHSTLRKAASLIAVLGLPLVAACGEESKAERPAGALVDTTRVVTEDVPTTLRAVGTVEGENQTVVKAEVDGQVSQIVADEGAAVEKGDVVLRLDQTPYRLIFQEASAALSRIEATLGNDRALLARYSKLLEAGALDQQTYEDVEARVKSGTAEVAAARARVNQARWNVDKTVARAPFSGHIDDRLVELGTYVSSGDDLFEIVDAIPVRVAFELPEPDVGALEEGDKVSFRVRTDPGKVHEGAVIFVSPSLNPETRTQTSKAEYANTSREITPGAFADVEVITAVHEDAAVIPEEALVTEGEQNFVFVVKDGKAEKREVTLGRRLEGRYEILKGLEGGEVIVIAGQRELRDGTPVRFAEAPARPAGEVGPRR
jgi:membrane fusion protein (multidrug efflux system)